MHLKERKEIISCLFEKSQMPVEELPNISCRTRIIEHFAKAQPASRIPLKIPELNKYIYYYFSMESLFPFLGHQNL
jgi:hypothetical protein